MNEHQVKDSAVKAFGPDAFVRAYITGSVFNEYRVLKAGVTVKLFGLIPFRIAKITLELPLDLTREEAFLYLDQAIQQFIVSSGPTHRGG
jgi:hypothetical protein